jgi:hypothetical protein
MAFSLAGLALPLILLGACTEAPQQTRSEQATYDACHRQADQIVEHENVAALADTQGPAAAAPEAPVAPPPPDLAGPTGNDLTKPPILPPAQ